MSDARAQAATQRNAAAQCAMTDPVRAMKMAADIKLPWYRAQAYFDISEKDTPVAEKARQLGVQAAEAGEDAYQRVVLRGWEIVGLLRHRREADAEVVMDWILERVPSVTPRGPLGAAYCNLSTFARLLGEDAVDRLIASFRAVLVPEDHWRMHYFERIADAWDGGDRSAILLREDLLEPS